MDQQVQKNKATYSSGNGFKFSYFSPYPVINESEKVPHSKEVSHPQYIQLALKKHEIKSDKTKHQQSLQGKN